MLIKNKMFNKPKFTVDQLISHFPSFPFQLRNLPTDELLRRKERLEKEMEAELHELQARFRAKRKAILDAIALKKNGTVQF